MPTPAIPDNPAATNGTNHGHLLPLLLEICEDFLANAAPATHHEVDILLRGRGITGGPGWLIDMLGLIRLHPQNTTHHDQPSSRHDT